MKKYLLLIITVVLINTSEAQTVKKFDAKFIYEKLVDIYHQSLTMNEQAYFSEFGFGLILPINNLPNGDIVHRAASDDGIDYTHMNNDVILNGTNKEFSFTTHSLSSSTFATIESRYSTSNRKEYQNLLMYVQELGYKMISDTSHSKQSQTFQMNKLQMVFMKSRDNSPRPYNIIHSIKSN